MESEWNRSNPKGGGGGGGEAISVARDDIDMASKLRLRFSGLGIAMICKKTTHT